MTHAKRKKLFNQEEASFILLNHKGRSIKETTQLFNSIFNRDITHKQMATYFNHKGLSCGVSTRFKKGAVPWNKDKKFPGNSNSGSFTKGQRPKNKKDIGAERISNDGYYYVKVGEPNLWKMKQHKVWEEHNGPVPKDSIILFLDQNKANCDINNLILISRAELALLNKEKLSTIPELNKSKLLISKIKLKESKLRKLRRTNHDK